MARYGGDYGRDLRRRNPYAQPGGMRSDGGPGNDWRDFPGEEGWYGEGYAGLPNYGFGEFDDRWGRGDRAGGGFSGGYAEEFRGGDGFTGFRGSRRYGAELGGSRGYGGYGGFGGGYGGDFRYANPQYGFGPRGYDAGADGARGRYDRRDHGYPGRESGYGQGWGGVQRGRGRDQSMRASELMTPDPEAVTVESPISEVAKKMRDLGVGIIPVIENADDRRLKGVITDRDIAIRAIAEGRGGDTKVSECMTAHVRTVNKNDAVQEVMRVMREDQVRRVPVTDREGRLVGIIAQADLAVDLAPASEKLQRQVANTIERLSEPAEPTRAGSAMAARKAGSNDAAAKASSGESGGPSSRSGGRRKQEEDRN